MSDDAKPETPTAKKFQQVYEAEAELRALLVGHTSSIDRLGVSLHQQWAKTARLFTLLIYMHLATMVWLLLLSGWVLLGKWPIR